MKSGKTGPGAVFQVSFDAGSMWILLTSMG
jgi:hypothetical protein